MEPIRPREKNLEKRRAARHLPGETPSANSASRGGSRRSARPTHAGSASVDRVNGNASRATKDEKSIRIPFRFRRAISFRAHRMEDGRRRTFDPRRTRARSPARARNASRAPNGTGRRGRSSARRRMSEPAARSPPAREAGDASRANAAAPRRRERPASAICNTRTRAGLTYINDRACDAAPQRRRPPIVAPCTGAAALTWLNARGHARRMLVHTCFACCSRGSPARSSDAARQAPDVPTAP